MKAKKRLGQHFLCSDDIIHNIIQASNTITNVNVLEIGPGIGNLTKEILANKPAKLCSIEIDKDLSPYHNKLLSIYKNYELIFDNALTIQETDLLPQPIKIIANLPYNISTELLFKWLSNITVFSDLTLMFQKEVAERIAASHGSKKYGKMSVMVQLLCKVEYLFDVPKHFFSPTPKVDSAVIKITPYDNPLFEVEIKSLQTILRILFCYRRKMIYTILRKQFDNVEIILSTLDIDRTLRPEQLSIKQLCDLTNALT